MLPLLVVVIYGCRILMVDDVFLVWTNDCHLIVINVQVATHLENPEKSESLK